MLTERSIPGHPQLRDPMALIRVKVLTAFYMAGRLYEPGVVVSMPRADALRATQNVVPPQVEIL